MNWAAGKGAPRVVAVMLTADRQEMTARALTCFLKQQGYPNRELFILDTGQVPFELRHSLQREDLKRIRYVNMRRKPDDTIGSLRNLAAYLVGETADVLMHWDSDDWSAPARMGDQVRELLAHPDRDGVGYHSMHFYRKADRSTWLYQLDGYALGTSMAYWREAWQRSGGFESRQVGEDTNFAKVVRFKTYGHLTPITKYPFMVAELHPGNTTTGKPPKDPSLEWTPAPHMATTCEILLGYADELGRKKQKQGELAL